MKAKRIVFTKIGYVELLEEEIGEVGGNQVLIKNWCNNYNELKVIGEGL